MDNVDTNASWKKLSAQIWAFRLYGEAEFCDERLRKRAVKIASVLAAHPGPAFTKAFEMWGQAKAAYRFVENQRVTARHLMQPMQEQTAQVCAGRDVVLLIQDTTTVVSDQPKHRDAMGPVNQSKAVGMLLHSCLATTRDGLALGVVSARIWTRQEKMPRGQSAHDNKPVLEKESARWIETAKESHNAIAAQCPPEKRPRLIHVCDREGDIHEFFETVAALSDSAVVRCCQNRRVQVGDETSLSHEAVARKTPLAHLSLVVPRSANQSVRNALVEVRAQRQILQPGQEGRRAKNRQPLALNLVEIREIRPPEGCAPLLWRLWTAERADTLADILAVLEIYKRRWRIEDMHLILKSGCRVEKMQFDQPATLQKALALYLPVAARILHLRDSARLTPDACCTQAFSDIEWRVLWTLIQKVPPSAAQQPPSLREAIGYVGRLGGHLGRKSDGPPGVRTLWSGLQDLQIAVRYAQSLSP